MTGDAAAGGGVPQHGWARRGAGRRRGVLRSEAYGIGEAGAIEHQSLIEMSLGSRSVPSRFGLGHRFRQAQRNMSGAPDPLAQRHAFNLIIVLAIIGFIVYFVIGAGAVDIWAITILAFIIGVTLIIPIGGADMPGVISMLNSYSGWAAAGFRLTLENTALIITGALVGFVGRHPSYQCAGMNRSFIFGDRRRVRRRDRGAGRAGGERVRSSRARPRTPPSS